MKNDFDFTNIFPVSNVHGIPFVVRIVMPGQRFGAFDEKRQRFALVHGAAEQFVPEELRDEPMIEFYDGRYDFTPFGQFVSRYYASTLLDHDSRALLLDGSHPAMMIEGDELQRVIGAAAAVTNRSSTVRCEA